MINFFALFEAALAKKPYLKLEIGYGKITDWIVQVIDTTDEEDRRIVDVQDCHRELAFAKAYVLLADFLSEECNGY